MDLASLPEIKPQLDKWEQLFIRECKTCKPIMRRFKRIFGMRCMLDTHHVDDYAVVVFAMRIVEKLELYSLTGFAQDIMCKDIYKPLKINNPYDQRIMALAVCKLTHWTPDERYIVPAFFRNKQKK